MKIEQIVTSTEISNRLRKALDSINVQIPSIFFRDYTGSRDEEIEMWRNDVPSWCEDNIPCYTASEIARFIPDDLYDKQCKTLGGKFRFDFGDQEAVVADTEADCRALMMIYLIENKFTNAEAIKPFI